MIAPPSRIDHLRRLVAWVLGLEPVDVVDMSEERAYRILAGERRHDASHLATLHAVSVNVLADEAPFAAQFWRGHTPTAEDHQRRIRMTKLAPTSGPPPASADDAVEVLAQFRVTASRGDRGVQSHDRMPEPPRATPDELREILKRAELHAPTPVAGLQ